ncbi:T-cell surface glycoprotein CD5 isoform 3-T3 [Ara ararauna]
MASRSLLLLLGMWAITSHGGAAPSTGEPRLRLTGGGCRCSGMLEVNWDGKWSRVCQDAAIRAGADGMCRRLGCGPFITEPLRLVLTNGKEPHTDPLRCQVQVDAPTGCVWEAANCTEHAALICSEPPKTTPEPPPATSPEPTGPPRLRLVDGDTACSGFLELHKAGTWGSVAAGRSTPGRSLPAALAARVCRALHCGSALGGAAAPPARGSPLPVRWEAMEPCGSRRVLGCFNGSRARSGAEPAFIRCSGSQPKALRRLASGPTPCEGDIEVFHGSQWRVLCDNRTLRAQWGRELCQELRCGNLSSSTEIRDPPSIGVTCGVPILHLCPLRDTQSCSRIGVVCQDSKPHPTGTAAGTICPERSSANGSAPRDSTRRFPSTATAPPRKGHGQRGSGGRGGTMTTLSPPRRVPTARSTQPWKEPSDLPTLQITPRIVTTTYTLRAECDPSGCWAPSEPSPLLMTRGSKAMQLLC